MKSFVKFFTRCFSALIVLIAILGCTSLRVVAAEGDPEWAKTTTVAPNTSEFFGIDVNDNGDAFAVGAKTGNGTFEFGNGVSVTGGVLNFGNAILVRYDSTGLPIWAKSTVSGSSQSQFNNCSTRSVK